MPDAINVFNSSVSSLRNTLLNTRMGIDGASSGRGRQASTMEDASALVPLPIMRLASSLRTGHVAVISQPPWISPSNRAYHPVEVPVLSSFCL